MRTVGIIGGGAAGMMAAIAAAGQGARVTILEANDRLGKKILATGNGKCNLGNEKLDLEEYYTHEPAFLESCLKRFGTEDTVDFFRKLGLLLKSKNGYLYPVSEQASAVLDVLRFEVAALAIEVVTGCAAEEIAGDERTGGIRVQAGGRSFLFDRVVLACGGRAAPKTGSGGSGYLLAGQLGHSLIPTVPALVQLRCREDFFKSVSGVRAEARLSVMRDGRCIAKERGELQLTDYGVSGIPVFQVSRVVNYMLLEKKETELVIDFLPDFSKEGYEQLYISRMLLQGQRTAEEFFTGMLNKKLMLLFIRLAGLKPSEEIGGADKEKVRRVFALCRKFTVHVTGSNGYENAQVCAGGVPLSELTEDLESVKLPGVYFAGELLDVDGKCGGYNLQWAWCSGYLAGTAAAK